MPTSEERFNQALVYVLDALKGLAIHAEG